MNGRKPMSVMEALLLGFLALLLILVCVTAPLWIA